MNNYHLSYELKKSWLKNSFNFEQKRSTLKTFTFERYEKQTNELLSQKTKEKSEASHHFP